MDRSGATLIELLLAVALVGSVASVMSLIFPRSTKADVESRRRWVASQLAMSKIQEIKQRPYSLIPLTQPPSAAPLYLDPADCDCAGVDWSLLPPVATQWAGVPATNVGDERFAGGVRYSLQVCINYVTRNFALGTWQSSCPGAVTPEPGLKNIRVRVGWGVSPSTYSIETESLAIRN